MRTGSVSAAAKLLRVSQPACSKTLRLIEQRLGFPLFVRLDGKLHATKEAEILLPEVERLFGTVDSVEHLADEIRDGFAGRLSIASVATLTSSLVTVAIARFRETRPGVRIDLVSLATRRVLDRLLEGRIDLGILDTGTREPSIEARQLCESAICCVMPRNHALAERRSIEPADLAGMPLISFAEETLTALRLREAFRAAAQPFRLATTTNQTYAACALVQDGGGLALVDPFAMLSGHFAGLVARPFEPRIEIAPHLAWSRARPASRISQEFAQLVLSLGAGLASRDAASVRGSA